MDARNSLNRKSNDDDNWKSTKRERLFFFFYPRHVSTYRYTCEQFSLTFISLPLSSPFHRTCCVFCIVNCNCNCSIRLFLGREAKKWRENGEIPSKVFERNFLSRRWKGRREMTQHTTMQATRETVSAAKLDSRWTAAWSNIVQWLSNELMHSPVHVPIMCDTIG